MVKYWNILYANKLAKVAFKCVLIYTHTKKKHNKAEDTHTFGTSRLAKLLSNQDRSQMALR